MKSKGDGDSAKFACLLCLLSCNSQVLPALKTQEEKLRQQLLRQRQEVQELEMNIESVDRNQRLNYLPLETLKLSVVIAIIAATEIT